MQATYLKDTSLRLQPTIENDVEFVSFISMCSLAQPNQAKRARWEEVPTWYMNQPAKRKRAQTRKTAQTHLNVVKECLTVAEELSGFVFTNLAWIRAPLLESDKVISDS